MRNESVMLGERDESSDNGGITGEIGMSSLLFLCLRREPSAGEIVAQIRSEARLRWRGLRWRNRSSTNRGQSSCLGRALPPTRGKTRKRQTDIGRYKLHTKTCFKSSSF